MQRFLFQGLLLGLGSLVARMPSVQDVYASGMRKAFAGLVASSVDHTIFSKIVQGAPIGYGLAVTRGSLDDTVVLGGTVYEGITEASHEGFSDAYPVGATAPVMRKGEIWVDVAVAVTEGEPVYFTPATGAITNVASGNTAIPGAVFNSSTTGAGLAKVFLG